MASGESGASMPVVSSNNSQHFSEINSDTSPNENTNATFAKRKVQKQEIKMLIANIQGLSAHLAELVFHLQATRPHVVLLQETWLDASVECVDIAGYFTVSRKDRSEGPNRGGVLILARNDFNRLVFIENAEKINGLGITYTRILKFFCLAIGTALVRLFMTDMSN